MTSHNYRQACINRDVTWFLCTVAVIVFTVVGCVWLSGYIPVTTPDPLPYPGWSDDEPEEDPCVSPAQRRYFEEMQRRNYQ